MIEFVLIERSHNVTVIRRARVRPPADVYDAHLLLQFLNNAPPHHEIPAVAHLSAD